MEAFSDGVIAVIITIMVLELRPPVTSGLLALRPLLPVFFELLISFVIHRHLTEAITIDLLQVTEHINGGILWGEPASAVCSR